MDKNFYIELLYKSLADGISAEEQHQLDDWMAASEENQSSANSIRQGWELSANYAKDLEVNLDDEFARLQQSIDLNISQPNEIKKDISPLKVVKSASEKKINPWKTWVGVAAAVLLLATTYFVFNPNSGEAVEFVTIETQANEIKEVILPDGTKVLVNENSTFTYPNKFINYSRKVELKGLAFFDVTKNEDKPFSIKTSDVQVHVLGTSFSVRAFDSEPNIEVFVKTGIVQMISNRRNIRTMLRANDKGTFNKEKYYMSGGKSKSLNELSWQNKTLVFDDTKLTQVLSDVENHFGVVLNLKDSNLAECPFNSIFKDKTLQEVLDAISKPFKIEVIKTDDFVYELKGGQCNETG